MEKRQLEDLGITDSETLRAVMKINGDDIEAAKKNAEKEAKDEAQKTIDSMQTQLDDANKKIDSFKDIDPTELQKEVADWKTKAEEADKARHELESDSAAKDLLRNAGVTDPLSLSALLLEFKKKELKFENNSFIGASEIIEGFKKQYPKHFTQKNPDNNNDGDNNNNGGKQDGFNLGGTPPPTGKKDTEELLFGSK